MHEELDLQTERRSLERSPPTRRSILPRSIPPESLHGLDDLDEHVQ